MRGRLLTPLIPGLTEKRSVTGLRGADATAAAAAASAAAVGTIAHDRVVPGQSRRQGDSCRALELQWQLQLQGLCALFHTKHPLISKQRYNFKIQ